MKKVTLQKASLALVIGLSAAAAAADDKPIQNEQRAAGEAAPAPPAASPETVAASAPAPVSRLPYGWRPIQPPAIPAVKDAGWARTPIDAFILAKVEDKGLKPSPDADRAAFIRRATLDVWGLIPTPEQVAAFVNDPAPDAYEKLADRLLASPHYGERQARFWLDLARYADSAGFQTDQTRSEMWRYRDYVINAFNQDKPYSRFVQEQLAGDELAPGDQDVLVAAGFLTGYPDNYNSRDLVQRKYQITTDITDTVGQAILGTTVGCARCHDHKTDKFSQKDYYSLQAFFANTNEVNKVPAAKGRIEQEFQAQQAKWDEATKDIRAQQAALLDPVKDKAWKYHKERYLTDSRDAIFKPEGEWTPLDRWINHRLANVTTEADYAAYLRDAAENKDNPDHNQEAEERWQKYKKLSEDLKKFQKLKPAKGSDTYTTVSELGHADAPPTFILFGGNHERPVSEVQPAFPAALTDQNPTIVPTTASSGRRTALANWLVSPQNPLTARVFVNRVWNEYFGKGIVVTLSDFGKAGEKPTNPELLDFLANNFVNAQGWSVKKLHRQILLSSVYRQSSAYREDAHAVDPDNKLLAVFPRKRLEAEVIRDSILVAAGKLDETVGGPSVFPPAPANLNAGNLWEVSKDPRDFNRRSLYIFTRRSVPYPLLSSFDMASSQQVHSKRDVTTTPLQALTLFNSDIVFSWSQMLAGRVMREAGTDPLAGIDRLYQILFGRNPDEAEKATLLAFLISHEKVIRAKAEDGKFSVAIPIGLTDTQTLDPIRAATFVDLVHVVVNSNDFIYRF
ncbi:protein of unknown function DUF1549 [Methylocella silvestris BL2]|uniref:DUF1553 domain-containing protein n=1 Tax=Methylocella silvestris (strain DSM 15510 / CIP 108128 / LMG 27833 / NCIMB 13906 / BL2) TaxID=395965 RepID=B8EMB2_METSB|nr:DUF1549 and DUF1553 domain-containing protein [Methylocella silvestris]ACK52040.1 protein of unknown function DUF1549 [Methylocella silvestris BL2]